MSIQQKENIVSPLILSYIKNGQVTTQEISTRLKEDSGYIPAYLIEFYIDQMREEHSICTEKGVHYIPQDKPALNIMLMTVAIGGMFACPILLNL